MSGKVLVGGDFTSYGGTTRGRVARINTDGTLDTGFTTPSGGANGTVRAITYDGTGKIYIGGDFTTYAGVTRQRIARLNTDGTLDTSFDSSSGANSTVYAVGLRASKLLIGGSFSTYAGTTRQGIARIWP